jgi:signal transduction histidine kinase
VLRALWDEPRLPAPPGVPWWDRLLAASLVPAALVEGVARDDVPWPAYSIALAMVCPLALLLRTRHPLAMLVVGYGAQTLAGVGPALAGRDYGVLHVTSCVLLFPYSLSRWGSGRSVVVGLMFLNACHLLREPLYGSSAASILVGVGFLMFPAALGAAVRFWLHARRREGEQIRVREREQLARELHDTVAHHVSGILIQAQAGRAVAASDPQRAVAVLGVVEEEAARSLAEMRSLVGLLREGAAAEREPAHGVADLPGLAARGERGAPVELSMSGDLERLGSSVDAAVYRLVQESLTNARRHAPEATRITVRVEGAHDVVRVTVTDDGAAKAGARRGDGGFGLVGMAERVELLGGSMQAGPRPGGGWSVSARIPRPEPA